MDNANNTDPPFLRDDNTGKDDGNNSVWIILLVILLCISVCALLVCKHRHVHAAHATEHQEKEDAVLDEVELGFLTLVATDSGERQDIPSRKTRLLDREETWSNAEFWFPGLLDGSSSWDAETLCMTGKHPQCKHYNVAIQAYVHAELDLKIFKLSKTKKWESVNEAQNAAAFCIAVGMNPAAVKLRFQLIEKLEKELDLPRHKLHILHFIKHVIDTVHVNNPFGDDNDIDGKIHDPKCNKIQ